jgi:secreted repeat protein with Y-X4-D motif
MARVDGAKQVTYNGKLLYTFYFDKPGNARGDGFDDAFGGQKFSGTSSMPTHRKLVYQQWNRPEGLSRLLIPRRRFGIHDA